MNPMSQIELEKEDKKIKKEDIMTEKIDVLKEYFKKEKSVVLAFLFGSKANDRSRGFSDWDIGVYFKPVEYLELEQDIEYKNENRIWSDLIDILETDDVDFVVLNRARPVLVYNVLRVGVPLVMKDNKLYFDLLCKASYEAMDWWSFVSDFWKIREQARSLSPEAKAKIQERLIFLEEQLKDIKGFKKLDWNQYRDDRKERRNVERWVENLVMSAIDIAEIVLASENKEIPQSYKDVLKVFTGIYIDKSICNDFSEFAKLRKIVVHEYIDLKWKKIKSFIEEADELYPKFIEKVKQMI